MRFSSTICVNKSAIVGENFSYPARTMSTASGHVYVSDAVPMSTAALRSDHPNVSRPCVSFRMDFFSA